MSEATGRSTDLSRFDAREDVLRDGGLLGRGQAETKNLTCCQKLEPRGSNLWRRVAKGLH